MSIDSIESLQQTVQALTEERETALGVGDALRIILAAAEQQRDAALADLRDARALLKEARPYMSVYTVAAEPGGATVRAYEDVLGRVNAALAFGAEGSGK